MYLTASLIQAYGVHQRSRREQKYVYTPPKKIPHSYDQYIDYGIFSKVKKSYSTRDVNKVLIIIYKKHIDASVKERPQTPLVPSEEICKPVLCNKHI